MEQAELSVDAGSLGQLDPEQLDPEHQFDFETEGFDFNLDGVYDETTQAVVQDNTADAVQDLSAVAVTTDNDEIGYEDDEEEIQIGSAQPEETETLEVVVKDDDAEAVTVIVTETRTEVEAEEVPVDYQDEIGYEDDDFAAADISIDLKPEQAVEPAAEHPIRQQTRIPESGQEAYDSTETRAQIEVTESGAAAIAEEELDLAAHGEDEAMDEHPDDAEKENREVFANHDDIAQAQYQDESVPEDYVADQDDDEDSSQGVSDLDRAIEDLTNSLRSIPEVEVLYNDGSYSLFGTSDDDPESFFLSGTKHLDKSLAGLLSSLREVLSDEISPTDELVIGFESLGLEFGERSNEKFLERSLRELLDCHAALAAKNFEDFSAAPTLRLMVQQDCEERFLQLLQEAELDDESPGQKDYDESEQQDEWPSANSLDDEQSEQAVQAQQPEEDPNAGHEDSGKHEDVDAGAHIPGPIPTASGNLADQTDASMEQNFSFQDSLDDTEYHESEAPDGGEESIDDQMGEHTEQHIDEHVEEHVVEEHVVEEHVVEEHVVEEHVVEEHVVEEHVAEDHVVEEHAEEQIEPHMEAFAGHPTEQNNHQFTTEDMDDIIAHEETRPENIPHEAPTDNQGGQQHDLGETGDVFEVEETSLEEFDGFTTAGNEGAEQATGSYGNIPLSLFLVNETSPSSARSDMNSSLDIANPESSLRFAHKNNSIRPPSPILTTKLHTNHPTISVTTTPNAIQRQHADGEEDYWIDYSEDDDCDGLSTPTQTRQAIQVSTVPVSSGAVDGRLSRASPPPCTLRSGTLQKPEAVAVSSPIQTPQPPDQVASRSQSERSYPRHSVLVSDSEDTEMSDPGSPQRTFFISHSRTTSTQSFSFSHTSDANVPDFQDDDLMLGYDHDAGLSMIEEQEAEYDVIVTLSAEDNVKEVDDGAVKNDQTVHNSRQQDEAVDNGPQYNSAIGDSGSIHTSTTMNGDEIDYDENDPAADSFNPESNAQVSAASLGVENDEIDWGNDGYEYHEDRGDVDTSIASEEPKEVALTPSSLAAKRSRTDEAEGLAEESDNKRRRT